MKATERIIHNRIVARRLRSSEFQKRKTQILDQIFENEMRSRYELSPDAKAASELTDTKPLTRLESTGSTS